MGSCQKNTTLLWVVLAMLSNNFLVLPVLCAVTVTNTNNFDNEKKYYSSPPHKTPSSGSHHHGHGSSHHHSHGGSHSSAGGQSNCGPITPTPKTPPTHHGGKGSGGSGSGSGGSGGYYPSPTPTPPSGGSGGSYDPTPTPSTPSGGGCVCSPPSSGGGSGGYYPSPTPTTPVSPSTPLVPSPPIITPVTPIAPSPPTLTPITPPTPFDPNTPPFPCTYWGSNPALIFGVLGWWATVGGVFGGATLFPTLSSTTSLQQVLNSPRNDGYGALYREGAASFLNSMASKNFYFTPKQVKDSLVSSLGSDKAAARQARYFKLANEGKLKRKH